MRQLLKAAQARKLDRIAAAYAVTGWILVQAASITFPSFDAPPWAMRVFIIAVLVGFPLTLIMAWLVTPAPKHAGKAQVSTRTDMTLLSLLGLIAVLAAAQFAYELWRLPNTAETNAGPVSTSSAPAPSEGSIAVLPFVNMSGDPKKEYFSDGISEELLNDLANIPALRVASRTSSFAFKGKNEDIKKIAQVLGVRAVLEGSIREDGKRIRITAQLINAADGYHLWSENFDRELTNVLVIQDEIAHAITKALTNKLLLGTTTAGKPASIDPEAYKKYLEGQFYFGPRTKDGVTRAVALFKDVTQLQPDFADGFAALGRALINHSEDFPEDRTLIPSAETALARALELDPNNLSALGSHLDLALHKLDWTAAEADANRMLAINPHSAITLHEMFRFYQIMGFPERALIAARSASELDPLSFVDKLNVAAALIHLARFPEAAGAAQAALKLEPDQPYVQSQLCTGYARGGRSADARKLADQFKAKGLDEIYQGCMFDIAVGENRSADAEKILDAFAAQFPNVGMSATDIADNYAAAGIFEKAMTWLDRAYDAKEFALFTIPYDAAIAPAFFQTPKWKAFWNRPLIKDWQAAHDRLEAEFAKGG